MTNSAKTSPNCVYLHPRSSAFKVRQILPKGISTFVHFATSANCDLVKLISTCLPSSCRIVQPDALILQEQDLAPGTGDAGSGLDLSELVEKAKQSLQDGLKKNNHLVTLNMLMANQANTDPLTIVDWKHDETVPVAVGQLRPDLLFKKDRRSYMAAGKMLITVRGIPMQ